MSKYLCIVWYFPYEPFLKVYFSYCIFCFSIAKLRIHTVRESHLPNQRNFSIVKASVRVLYCYNSRCFCRLFCCYCCCNFYTIAAIELLHQRTFKQNCLSKLPQDYFFFNSVSVTYTHPQAYAYLLPHNKIMKITSTLLH